MTAYLLVSVWLVSAALCYYIARSRGCKLFVGWDMALALLGPFAIPLMYLIKPKSISKNALFPR